MSEDVLQAGDRMLFSTELLKELKELKDDPHRVMVQVLKIETNVDGLKVVYLGTVPD